MRVITESRGVEWVLACPSRGWSQAHEKGDRSGEGREEGDRSGEEREETGVGREKGNRSGEGGMEIYREKRGEMMNGKEGMRDRQGGRERGGIENGKEGARVSKGGRTIEERKRENPK